MRLLLINNEYPPIGGGGSTLTLYVARYLAQMGHEVLLVTSAYGDLPRQEVVDGVRIRRVPAVRRHMDQCSIGELLTFAASASLFLLREVPRFKPDVIQAFFAVPAGGIAYLINLVHGTSYCIYMGGSDVPGANPDRYGWLYPVLTPLIRRFWRRASMVSAASRRLVMLARQADPGVQVELIPNGVDLGRFSANGRAPQPGPVRLLSVGRLLHRKGYDYVLEALPEVRRRAEQDFVFEIVGTGSEEARLRAMAQRLGVADRVRFLGRIPYGRLHEAYRSADVFVLTSRTEGMPCAALEAMGCGLPVVLSRVSGNEELVVDDRNGYLVDLGDRTALVEALADLVFSQERRERMGQESAMIAREYDWFSITRRYEAAYRSIVEQRQRG